MTAAYLITGRTAYHSYPGKSCPLSVTDGGLFGVRFLSGPYASNSQNRCVSKARSSWRWP